MRIAYDEEAQLRARHFPLDRAIRRPGTPAARPFCLYVSHHHPHDPFHVTQRDRDLYAEVDIPLSDPPARGDIARSVMDDWADDAHETARYALGDPGNRRMTCRAYAALTMVDRWIGELVDAPGATGELENTLIMFTADHGDMMTERGMVHKRCFYEWSVRVPLIARFPGAEHAGLRVPAPVSLIDLFPTVLDVAGVPAERRTPVDGDSLLPVVARAVRARDAAEADVADRPVFSEYHLEKVHAPCFMVRRGRYRYVLVHGHDEQLFDLEADPGEATDLATVPRFAQVRDALRALVHDRFDVARIEAESWASVAKRVVVRDAMRANDTHRDYEPRFDPTIRFVC
ncbi:sulfatase-like hydrolase/transferase [Xylanimonas protaetiae]|uniref:Sulfatase N-terminal domain-containing protein n=1 Tax=Xylanimonas protaetiae TaxID=2509457 RepID=A0A4P6FBH9_9MICO|nr:sulfatase-like hydrolase/transferase [Xylanimonas protaetiae]QAY71659.1 hypothetical protein ET471_17790 [Xylanimonas protaetiae]